MSDEINDVNAGTTPISDSSASQGQDQAQPADPVERDYNLTDLVMAVANAAEIADKLREDIYYDTVVRQIALVQTKLDEARLWVQEGIVKFKQPIL